MTWIKRNFYIPETKNDPVLRGRIGLEKYQEDTLREILTPDEKGNYKYSIVIWSDIKKSHKSSIAAAVNLARATHAEWAEFFIVANDLKQAFSRVSMYIRRAIDLNPKMKKSYKSSGYRVETPARSFIESIPIDPGGEAGGNADMVTFSELWAANQDAQQRMWCLDEKTEVLTHSGWKLGAELTTDDLVAVYIPEVKHVSWEKPRDVFCKKFRGIMHLYEHKNFSIMCTEDHRLFGRYSYDGGRDGKDKYEKSGVMRSNELRASGYAYYHPTVTVKSVEQRETLHGIYIDGTKFHQTKFIGIENWASFLGLYLTEGSTSDFRGVPCQVRISQLRAPHPKQYDEIHSILKNIFGDWVKPQKLDGFKVSNTELAKITKSFGKTFEKRIPRYIIDHQNLIVLENFLHSYILGDGHTRLDGGIEITCGSKGMADDLQEITFRLGKQSSVRSSGKYWRMTIYTQNVNPSFQKKQWKTVYYDGLVWCPSVSTGLFIARREGRTFITGNTEMTIPPGKHGKAFRWVESYAGFLGESKLLYSLYKLGVLEGELLWPDRLYNVTDGEPTQLELYVNKRAGMICLWNTQPRCPDQTKEYYASEEAILLPNEFLRVHRNQWVSSTETFLPMAWYDACKRSDAEWPQINFKRQSMVIALDAGMTDDNFGLWMGCRHPEKPDEVVKIVSKKWAPPRGGKIDFQGTPENPGPELMVRQLCKDYNVVWITYDEHQLYDMMNRLRKDGLTIIKRFPQGEDRLVSDSQLRTVVRERRYWHRGESDEREHFQNADAKIGSEDDKIRIVKRADEMKIDLAVCASMGVHTVLRLNL